MNGYQWTVLLAAWLGWGFDIFDALLFNYVAPNCVPTLLGLTIGSPQAKSATLFWTGLLTSILLVGWAVGGILFGKVADRIGRTKTLLLTMSLYALGTASCAFAPNIWVLVLCRVLASLGIGGEWAAGASMVAEVVPEKRRVEAGAILYTASPLGLFLATFINFQVAGVFFKASPETSWRYVFLFGLLPAGVAFLVRLFVKEPERWQTTASSALPPQIRELFNRENLALTRSGLLMAVTALLAWWSCNAFIPVVATGLAQVSAQTQGLERIATLGRVEEWKALATNCFNWGGLLGTLLAIPAAKYLGRRLMFQVYFALSGVAVLATFGLDLEPITRLYMYFPIGLTVFGIFGSFTYYLPELFPTRLRATGSGFCYNAGRVIAAGGPFLVGYIATQGANSLQAAITALFWTGFVPLVGLLFTPWVIETKGRLLAD
ncbi:MFS transporter [Anthocerotibacter panamensis]|uniref:MFS transporter n=1 Tax=Anthocerotibacter panamensis TaxID=2857077 RepID=UPI001FD9BF29|nr:MFS transporter [Anthocerotibacter panamensis]